MFINTLLEGKIAGGLRIDFYVHPSCTTVIEDFELTLEDTDGTKLKKKVKDEATGRKYEENGHCTDATDYIFCRMFIRYFDRFRKNG